jgi:probable HAF family extracellular repeat protein
MWLRILFDSLKARGAGSIGRRTRGDAARRRRATSRLGLEPLEDRRLLTSYTFTDLGNLAGFPSGSSVVDDVNASGQVVGATYDPNAGRQRAVLWDGSVVTNLGTLGGARSYARAINDRGQIVGLTNKPDGSDGAFLINPEDSDGDNTPDRWFRDLDADGANDLMVELPMDLARDINNLGQVIGADLDGTNYLWTPDAPNGTTGRLTPLGMSAAAINDAGQIVGQTSSHMVLWQSGVMIELGFGAAEDINASGQVVGNLAGVGAFLWTPNTSNGATGTFNYLEPLPAVNGMESGCFAFDLNDAGQVVGTSLHWVGGGPEGSGGELKLATLWAGGEPQSLSLQVVPAPEALGAAVAINDSGQIVGDMSGWSFTPSGRPYLLTPNTTPLISVSDATISEGNTGTRAATFTVTISAASTQPVTLAYATANVSAAVGSDYQVASGTLTFAPGETSKTVTVLVNGDRLAEANETFVVNLSGPTGATIGDGQAVGTIVDNEPRISIGDVTKSEGKNGKTTLFTFTVTLSTAYDQPVTMSFKTVNGTARTSNSDYVAKTGTLTFAPGETTKTITIVVKGDSKREASETYYLDLFGQSSNARFTKSRGIGTILNDD